MLQQLFDVHQLKEGVLQISLDFCQLLGRVLGPGHSGCECDVAAHQKSFQTDNLLSDHPRCPLLEPVEDTNRLGHEPAHLPAILIKGGSSNENSSTACNLFFEPPNFWDETMEGIQVDVDFLALLGIEFGHCHLQIRCEQLAFDRVDLRFEIVEVFIQGL